MKSSNSFINKKNINKTFNEKIPKYKKNKATTRQTESNLLQIHSQKNKSFFENPKFNNIFSKKKQISEKSMPINKTEKKKSKKLTNNHRPIISTDFSLCLEYGSMIDINKNRNNENNSNNKKNNLIKVNTKRNNFKNLLSFREENKTNKKIENNNKSKNYEKIELFKNLSEINIFSNQEKKRKNKEKITYDMSKIKYIQKWWKNLFKKKNFFYNSILFLIKSIKKIFLFKIYILIKNNFPSISYFFHKWNNIIYKKEIIKQIIMNSDNIQIIKNNQKLRYSLKSLSNISQRNSIDKSNQTSINKSKKINKTNKPIINQKRKIISISTNNCNTNYSKKKENNNNFSQIVKTTKQTNINNKINNIYLNNVKKSIPYSPKSNLNAERHISPINSLAKNLQTNKNSLPKKMKKSNSKIFQKDKDTVKKPNKLNQKATTDNMKIKKDRNKKNNRQNINNKEQKSNSKLNDIINNSKNNSNIKNKTQSNKEKTNFGLFPNKNSQFNNYILNINKKSIDLSPHYQYYSKAEKKENKKENEEKSNIASESISISQYNTEINSNKTNFCYKNLVNKSNTKMYENCLYMDKILKNISSKGKKELFNINSNNKKEDNKINKKNNNIPINKKDILNKREKEKIAKSKDISSQKKKLQYNISISSTNNAPITDANSSISKLSSIDNNSNRTKKIFRNNNEMKLLFNFWKEFIDKENILQELIKLSKLIYHISQNKKLFSLKDSIQKIIETRNKNKFYQYILKCIFKMIISVMQKIFIYKSNSMREIKKNKNYNIDLLNKFQRGKSGVINNININNYIHYDEYNLIKKRKARSPHLLSKKVEFRSNNNSRCHDYNDKRLTLTNSNSDKIINFYLQTKNIFSNNNIEETKSVKTLIEDKDKDKITQINKELIKNNSGYLNNKIVADDSEKTGNGVIVDQINQLKMVFNLLERHKNNNNKNKISYTLFDCFNKWKLYINEINFLKKKIIPKINEKIINLKPFQTNKIINNIQNNPDDLSLRKNFSLTKMSPKIINVINVQNFNENNNYNYNFKYLPIKDIPIYPLKPRHSYELNNIDNITNINPELNKISKSNLNENKMNLNIDNNLNTTSILKLNNNKQINTNIVYHKKKLGQTYINNNYNFNFNNNIDNNPNYNSYFYNLDQKVINDTSPFLFLNQNQSQILLPTFSHRVYNLENRNMNLGQAFTVFRDKSSKNIRTCVSNEQPPEQKYGFKKLNQIEEKEINFDNISIKKLYVKKPHLDGKRNKTNDNNETNKKASIFKKDENKDKKSLIQTLNVQFGKKNINNKIIDNKANKYTTISEDIFDMYQTNDKIGQVSLKKKSYRYIYSKNMLNNKNEEFNNMTGKAIYQINRVFSCKNVRKEFKYFEKIQKERKIHSLEVNRKINKKSKIEKLNKIYYLTI